MAMMTDDDNDDDDDGKGETRRRAAIRTQNEYCEMTRLCEQDASER